MQVAPLNIVLRVCILPTRVEHNALLLVFYVREDHFDMELFLLRHLHLHVDEVLHQMQLLPPGVLWQLEL